MDCLQALKKLPAEVVWLTVTSPPYNIGKAYENPMALEEYLDWCEAWVAEIYRITRPNGAFWLNLGYFFNTRSRKGYTHSIFIVGTGYLFI